MPRLYTVAEANALLLELVPLLEELRAQARTLRRITSEIEQLQQRLQSNGHGHRVEELTGQVAVAEHDLRKGLTRLRELDIELKDIEHGLIDFYHRREGRLVFLCWRLGETAVGYWHEIEAGFAGRQPL